LRWALMVLGCLALATSAQLPWMTSAGPDGAIAINGFNSASIISGSNNLVAQLMLLGNSQQDLLSQIDLSGDASSGIVVIPSLSSIPATLGGTDSSARWGIFVLVLGAIATFSAIWTLWGEIDRRRSLARGVFVAAVLSLIPLGYELSKNGLGFASSSGDSTGVGIYVGIAGAIVAMVAGGSLLFALRTPQERRSRKLKSASLC
jgi:hypothetical protein